MHTECAPRALHRVPRPPPQIGITDSTTTASPSFAKDKGYAHIEGSVNPVPPVTYLNDDRFFASNRVRASQ